MKLDRHITIIAKLNPNISFVSSIFSVIKYNVFAGEEIIIFYF